MTSLLNNRYGILALDLGTSLGWACAKGGRLRSGRHLLAKDKDHHGKRYAEFRRWARWLIQEVRPSLVIYEHVPRHNGVSAAHVYGGLLGELEVLHYDFMGDGIVVGVPVQKPTWALESVTAGEWKKGIGLKGNAPKIFVAELMERRGIGRADLMGPTYDESDALGILDFALRTHGMKLEDFADDSINGCLFGKGATPLLHRAELADSGGRT